MEPNFVNIEATLSEVINLTAADTGDLEAFQKFRDELLKSAVGVEIYQRTLRMLKENEFPNSVLFNAMAMMLMAGYRAGAGSAEGRMLEEMFR